MIDRRFPRIFQLSTVWADWDESAQKTILSRTSPFMIRWMQSRSCFPKRHVASIATKFRSGGLPRRVCHRTMTGTTEPSFFRTWQNLSFCPTQNIPFYGFVHLLKCTSGFPLGVISADSSRFIPMSRGVTGHAAWQVSEILASRFIAIAESRSAPNTARRFSALDLTGQVAHIARTEIVRNICHNNHVVESWLLKFLKIWSNDIGMRWNFLCHLIQHIHEDMPNLSPKEASMRKLKNADFQMSHHLDCLILERFFHGNVN